MARRIVLNEVPNERPVAEVIAEIRSLYFKTTAKTIERDFDRDFYLSAQDAKTYGLIDHVITAPGEVVDPSALPAVTA